jgi:hypothetical protein
MGLRILSMKKMKVRLFHTVIYATTLFHRNPALYTAIES